MGEAANGKDAMDQIEKLQPQIVISDVVMPLMDGVDFTVAFEGNGYVNNVLLSLSQDFQRVKPIILNM
mgnify:CR=1 FL=1